MADIRRANIGAGSIRPEGWHNYDITERGLWRWDVRRRLNNRSGTFEDYFDYAVANHLLGALTHDELPGALTNIRTVLKPGGVLRVIVSDAAGGFMAWHRGDLDWFPPDVRFPDVDSRFCTWLTWFGTHRSMFTFSYLSQLLEEAGFRVMWPASYQQSFSGLEGICDLDDRERESMFVEARK